MLLPVYINTYPAPENYFYIYTYLIPLRAGEAWEVFKNIFPASEKYLYTLFRRRRSAYIHLSGAEKPEKYLYTPVAAADYYIQHLTKRLWRGHGQHTYLIRTHCCRNNWRSDPYPV